MIIEMILSGFLFLFVLVLNLAMGTLDYLMEKDDYDPDADLQSMHACIEWASKTKTHDTRWRHSGAGRSGLQEKIISDLIVW